MTARPASIDFLRLNGHAVRVTSWTGPDADGRAHLVIITRGSRDAGLLEDVLAGTPIRVEVPDEEPLTFAVDRIERHHAGAGQSGITRFGITFRSATAESTTPVTTERSLEQRVTALEAEIEQLKLALARFLHSEAREE